VTIHFTKVLIVDDDEDIRFLVRMGLERLAGKQVEEAASLDGAMVTIAATCPDLVLLDNDIDGEMGLDLFARLPASHPPIVLVTARSDVHTTAPYLAAGAVAVLQKPFDPVNLCATLERLLA